MEISLLLVHFLHCTLPRHVPLKDIRCFLGRQTRSSHLLEHHISSFENALTHGPQANASSVQQCQIFVWIKGGDILGSFFIKWDVCLQSHVVLQDKAYPTSQQQRQHGLCVSMQSGKDKTLQIL
jgi:hypothetical protein